MYGNEIFTHNFIAICTSYTTIGDVIIGQITNSATNINSKSVGMTQNQKGSLSSHWQRM